MVLMNVNPRFTWQEIIVAPEEGENNLHILLRIRHSSVRARIDSSLYQSKGRARKTNGQTDKIKQNPLFAQCYDGVRLNGFRNCL